MEIIKEINKCPKCGEKLFLKRIEPKEGTYKDKWICSNKFCNYNRLDDEGEYI